MPSSTSSGLCLSGAGNNGAVKRGAGSGGEKSASVQGSIGKDMCLRLGQEGCSIHDRIFRDWGCAGALSDIFQAADEAGGNAAVRAGEWNAQIPVFWSEAAIFDIMENAVWGLEGWGDLALLEYEELPAPL